MIPQLKDRETYCGIALAAGKAHHIVLLHAKGESMSYQAALDFAKTTGGNLPSAQELAIAHINAPTALHPGAFWCRTEYEVATVANTLTLPSCARAQRHIGEKMCAVVVRRVPV